MTRGEQFVESLPRKVRFYDRNERRNYALTRAVAAYLIDNPNLVKNGVAYAEQHMAADPTQSRDFAIWRELLQCDVGEIVRSLLADTPRGALLRDTQPVFVVLPAHIRQRIIIGERSGAVMASVVEPLA